MERELEAIEAERELTDAPPRTISTPTDRRGRRDARARGTHRCGFYARAATATDAQSDAFPLDLAQWRSGSRRCARRRMDFAAKLQKTIRVQLIKIPKKVRRRVRARPARRRASHFVTSPVRGSEPTDSIPPQVRVLSLEQFSEDFGRDVSKELLANINLRAGLPADANGAEATTADDAGPPLVVSPRSDARLFPLSTCPAADAFPPHSTHPERDARTSFINLERSPERPISPSPATHAADAPAELRARSPRPRRGTDDGVGDGDGD